MLADSCGFLLIFLITLVAAIPLGAYMKRVYAGEKSLLDFLKPLEKRVFKICGADPVKSMNWKQYLFALLTIQVSSWVVPAFIMLLLQGRLFLNPASACTGHGMVIGAQFGRQLFNQYLKSSALFWRKRGELSFTGSCVYILTVC